MRRAPCPPPTGSPRLDEHAPPINEHPTALPGRGWAATGTSATARPSRRASTSASASTAKPSSRALAISPGLVPGQGAPPVVLCGVVRR